MSTPSPEPAARAAVAPIRRSAPVADAVTNSHADPVVSPVDLDVQAAASIEAAPAADEPSVVPAQHVPAQHVPPARPMTSAAEFDRNNCTAPQLRRFIKSRTYVPMHELRRRFALNGDDDDVTILNLDAGARIFVGLPNREGRLLGELLRSGDIGYELSLDPISPIVVGVYPMRPVPRT